MSERSPIEIKASDLIPRPTDMLEGGKTAAGGFNLNSIKDILKTAKEIKALATEFGIDLDKIKPQLLGKKESEPDINTGQNPPQATSSDQQIQTVIKALIIHYGDLPIDELIDRLKADYGSKKLSAFLKGKQ